MEREIRPLDANTFLYNGQAKSKMYAAYSTDGLITLDNQNPQYPRLFKNIPKNTIRILDSEGNIVMDGSDPMITANDIVEGLNNLTSTRSTTAAVTPITMDGIIRRFRTRSDRTLIDTEGRNAPMLTPTSRFDGSTANINVNINMNVGATIEAFMDFTNTTSTEYFFGGTNHGIRYDGSIFLLLTDNNATGTLNYDTPDEHIKLTITRNSQTEFEFFVDDVSIGTMTNASFDNLLITRIGSRSDGFYFSGSMHTLRVDNELFNNAIMPFPHSGHFISGGSVFQLPVTGITEEFSITGSTWMLDNGAVNRIPISRDDDLTDGWTPTNAVINNPNTFTTTAIDGRIFKILLSDFDVSDFIRIRIRGSKTGGNLIVRSGSGPNYIVIPSTENTFDITVDEQKGSTNNVIVIQNSLSGETVNIDFIDLSGVYNFIPNKPDGSPAFEPQTGDVIHGGLADKYNGTPARFNMFQENELGPELVTNGDFSDGLTGWTGNGITLEGQAVRLTRTGGATTDLEQQITTEVGRKYLLSYEILETSVANLYLSSTSAFPTTLLPKTVGTHELELTTVDTSTRNRFVLSDANGTMLVSNFSMRQITNEILPTFNFEDIQWQKLSSTVNSSNSFTTTGTGGLRYQLFFDIGRTYSVNFSGNTTASTCEVRNGDGGLSPLVGTINNNPIIFTATSRTLYLRHATGGTTSNVNLSIKELDDSVAFFNTANTDVYEDAIRSNTNYLSGEPMNWHYTWLSQPFINQIVKTSFDNRLWLRKNGTNLDDWILYREPLTGRDLITLQNYTS